MTLTLDAGNTRLSCGFFNEDKLVHTFCRENDGGCTEEALADFFLSEIKRAGLALTEISEISACSVVPSMNSTITKACKKAFGKEVLFLQSNCKTGLKISYNNPEKLGTDRIAAAIGATALEPDKNIIVVDMGTATTVDVITKEKEFCGGAILPGMNLMMKSLVSGTAQLPEVQITQPEKLPGTSTTQCIQAGVYYGALGGIKELIQQFTREIFNGQKSFVIATGGLSYLFENEGLFDRIEKNLVLEGLNQIIKMNK